MIEAWELWDHYPRNQEAARRLADEVQKLSRQIGTPANSIRQQMARLRRIGADYEEALVIIVQRATGQ